MTANLPKPVVTFTDDLLHRIAMDVGKEVVAYIEHAYPEMFARSSAANSAKLSIRNATHNAIMAAVRAADEGRSEQRIAEHAKQRRTLRRLRKIASEASPENADATIAAIRRAIP